MDWDLAIKRNSEALKGIVASLFTMLGLDGEATVLRLPRSLHSAVLRLLRPTESAVRRLIVIAARGVVVTLKPVAWRPMAKPAGPIGKSGGSSRPSFQLFDPRKNFARPRVQKIRRNPPRIHFFGNDDNWGNDHFWENAPTVAAIWAAHRPIAIAAPPPPPSDGLVAAARLTRRLQALKSALEDLPRQARRLVRWQERRKASPWPKSTMPLRPGHPPGHRRKPIHEIDEVLIECDILAWEAMKPDTS